MKELTTDRIRNVAIVGHGSAGKTMLVEHMLYTAQKTDRLGSIESGTTQSDFDSIETRRKISLSASITSAEWHDYKINIIDVPGFPDFAGDLFAVARVVESMIIVTEAKRDLDVGFELAYEVAQKHGLATCIFVNKLERDNSDFDGLMETLHERFGKKIVSTQIPIGKQTQFSGVLDLLNMKVYKGKDRGESFEEVPREYELEAVERREKMMDAAAEGDDKLAEKYLSGESLTEGEIEHGLMFGIETGRVVPVLLGSASTGIGIATLLDRITMELPSPIDFAERKTSTTNDPNENRPTPEMNAPASLLCFKTSADPFVGKINYFRVFDGQVQTDSLLVNATNLMEERLHNLFLPHGKGQVHVQKVTPGDICGVAKLSSVRAGDTLCAQNAVVALPRIEFPIPTFRNAIRPATKQDEDRLASAIEKILEEDPTLRYVRDSQTHQEILEGLGDVHLDSVVEKLKVKFGVNVNFEPVQVQYRETVQSCSKAQGRHKRQSGGKGQFGDCWIELEPLARGGGFVFESRIVGGSIPKNFIPAIEKGIREELEKGFVAGYPAVDLKVTVFDGSYHDVDSNEQAFKTAGAIAIREAFSKAKPILLEPIVELKVSAPEDSIGEVVGDLNGRRARLLGIDSSGKHRSEVVAHVPLVMIGKYALDLRSMTKGRGNFSQNFYEYEELPQPETKKLISDFESRRSLHEHA